MATFCRSLSGRGLRVGIALSVAAGGLGFRAEAAKLDRLGGGRGPGGGGRLRPGLRAFLAPSGREPEAPMPRAVEPNGLLLRGFAAHGPLRLQAVNPQGPRRRGLRRSLATGVRDDLGMAMDLGAARARRHSDTGGHQARITPYAIRLAENRGELADPLEAEGDNRRPWLLAAQALPARVASAIPRPVVVTK